MRIITTRNLQRHRDPGDARARTTTHLPLAETVCRIACEFNLFIRACMQFMGVTIGCVFPFRNDYLLDVVSGV